MRGKQGSGVGAGLVTDALRHHAKLIALVGLVGLLAGGVCDVSRAPSYQATTAVLVTPVIGNAFAHGIEESNGRTDGMRTEAQIVGSDEVTEAALAEMPGTQDTSAFRDGLNVALVPNTRILRISFTATAPKDAQRGAEAYARAYLGFGRRRVADAAASELSGIDKEVRHVRREFRRATQRARMDAAVQRPFQRQVVQTYVSQLNELRATRARVRGRSPQVGSVITPAEAPAQPVGLGLGSWLLLGLAVGLFVGLLLALARARAAGRVNTTAEVRELGVPVLAALPNHRWARPADHAEEEAAVRRLRGAVVAAAPSPSVVAVTCCPADVDEPGIAARLSLALRDAGSSVILVDSTEGEVDPTGTLPEYYALGVSDALMTVGIDARPMLIDADPRLQVLPRGLHMEEAVDRFLPRQLTMLLQPLVCEVDFVVVRAPTVQESTGEAMTTVAGCTVLVVIPGMTTRADIVAAVEVVERAGRSLLGAVLTPANRNEVSTARLRNHIGPEHPKRVSPRVRTGVRTG